jgi:hypothetical protein
MKNLGVKQEELWSVAETLESPKGPKASKKLVFPHLVFRGAQVDVLDLPADLKSEYSANIVFKVSSISTGSGEYNETKRLEVSVLSIGDITKTDTKTEEEYKETPKKSQKTTSIKELGLI